MNYQNCDPQQQTQRRLTSQRLLCPNSTQQVSDLSPRKSLSNISNWYHLIKNYLSQREPTRALLVYTQIRDKGVYTLSLVPLILKACAQLSLLTHGKALHSESVKVGVDDDVKIGTSLVSLYGKCLDIVDARKVFDLMPQKNVVTWNALIGGYLVNKDVRTALSLFGNMSERTAATWNQMIDGLANNGDLIMARELFDKIPIELRTVVTWTVMVDVYARNGEMDAARKILEEMPERNNFVWSSMISGYCKKGDIKEAEAIFYRIPIKNSVNWNSWISGLSRNGFCEEAIEAFSKMQNDGFEPDEVTAASVLSACAQLGSLGPGKRIHLAINEKGIKINDFVLNGLIDMYIKCGDLDSALKISEKASGRNVACWNSLISGFANHEFSVKPDEISFLSVLSACSHGGLLEEGLNISSKMEKYGLTAGIKHYGCLIDLLGRAGRFKEALDVIKGMPMKPNDAIWGSILGACRMHSEIAIAEQVLEDVGRIGSDNDSHYVLLSNIYAASQRWEKAEKARMAMMGKKLQKTPGCSSFQA
ncbi:hypothetical protein Nepgr_023432 [Nepenthes gracilis]|uniref:Pentatricopeptide repeat-containing protein n=1 Tax=Nepenthes gracilis TaxID=150966 RepID=A0AAD3T185_NEPGR|nr:hypothetical protein Nepgr_023432 [Nepenthes gracilis]